MEETRTRKRIIVEAKALLNEEGLDSLSLRKLAARLGVSALSLYWHFADKSALLSTLLEEMFYEVLP
jgi:TetR/AcrR family transcriptional regulator, tetracycline repressor protein